MLYTVEQLNSHASHLIHWPLSISLSTMENVMPDAPREDAQPNFRKKTTIFDWRNEELECTHICCHLQTLFMNLENFKSFFPDFFASENEELFHDYSMQSYNENVNTEDENISQTKIHGSFNKEQGLWEYPSVTNHKPEK